MITRPMLDIYRRFSGEVDGWKQSGSDEEKAMMTDEDWLLIDRLLRGLKLCSKGLGNPAFCAGIEEEVRTNCDAATTVNAMIAMMYD